MQHHRSAVRRHVRAVGGVGGRGLKKDFSPGDPCVLIIESPNVSVFPWCFQGLL